MVTSIPDIPEGTATGFSWLADKVLGGAFKALNWGWDRIQWAAAQGRYDEQIIKQYGIIRIFGQTTPKPLQAIFTDVYVLNQPTALRRFSPQAIRKHLWEEDRSVPFRTNERRQAETILGEGKHYYIQGKPGAGKTTFLKYLAVRESQQGRWGQCLGKVPIFVTLKEFAESGRTLIEFIVKQFDVCYFPEAAPFIEGLLKNGKALVLFDGLDEVTKTSVTETDQRGHIAQVIQDFSHTYGECHIIITCRIAATEYTFDPSFKYLEVADFTPDQVDAFVRNWFWDSCDKDNSSRLANQMLEELDRPEHAGIRDLSRNPLLLTLLCLNYTETLSFPTRRVEVYDEALSALLKKWDASRSIHRGSQYKNLSLGRKQQMFESIAYDGFLEDEILFEQDKLENRLLAYLAYVPEMPTSIDVDAESVLHEIIEQHGIFTEQSRGLFSFSHLTFQEYYVAKHITESATGDSIKAIVSRISDDKWREVFLLTASLWQDATPFLIEFEQALQRLIAHSPAVIAWLNWIGQQASKSATGYRQPVIRLFYGQELYERFIFSHSIKGFSINRDREARIHFGPSGIRFAMPIINALDSDFSLHSNVATFLELFGPNNSTYFTRYPHAMLSSALLLVKKYDLANNLGLQDALDEIIEPVYDNLPGAVMEFAQRLKGHIESSGVLNRYVKLQHELNIILRTKIYKKLIRLGNTDIMVLEEYFHALSLFHDCLQLAYTHDRQQFEERYLLPSTLT